MAQKPTPLGRRQLQMIVDMIAPGGLVRSEPVDGYVEIVFPGSETAIRFVEITRDGRYEAAPFVDNVVTISRVEYDGPVTFGITLAPAWRPAGEVAA